REPRTLLKTIRALTRPRGGFRIPRLPLLTSPGALAPRRKGLFRDPAVAAFLERPLELGVRGAKRLVPFPRCLHGAGERPGERVLGLLRRASQGAWQFTGWRQAVPAG